MKKTLAIILSLTVIFSMLQMNVFAAKENFIKINKVSVNEVPGPAAGTEIQFTANCETDHVAIENICWYEKKTESETGSLVSKGAKFRPGYFYTATVELKIAHNAYYFEGNGASVTATFNGKAATVTTLGTAERIKVSHTFTMCLATVSKFDFKLAAPTAGAAPHYPLLSGTGYESNNRGNNGAAYENGIYWRNETDNKVLYPKENPKFEAGKTYSANITVATTTGYRVASSYTVTVNGKTIPSTKVDKECITFKVEFKVPEAGDDSDKPVSSKPDEEIPQTNDPTQTKPNTNVSGNSGNTDTLPDGETTQTSENDDGQQNDGGQGKDDGKNGVWIWIVLAVVVLLVAGGIVTFVVLKKKKAE